MWIDLSGGRWLAGALSQQQLCPALIPNVAVWCRQQARTLEAQLRVVPDDADRRHALGQAQLALGDFRNGFQNFEARLRDRTAGTGWQTAQPRWMGEPVEAGFDGTLYVQIEQGLGDAIMMARYLPLCARRWAQIVCDVRPPLYRFFKENYGRMIVPLSATPLEYDFAIPMLSLPLAFQTTERTIPGTPYLSSNGDPRFAGAIGLAWAGASWHRDDAHRSLPVELVADFVRRHPAHRWLSLQVDQVAPLGMGELRGLVQDVADTAAVVQSLSLVITCDTMVGHLAGALGVTCWLLLPYIADWRWQLGRTDSPWYAEMTLFRQRRPGDWAEVLARVSRALDKRGTVPYPLAHGRVG